MAPSEHVSAFERIRQVTGDDGEFWSARDLSDVLGYTQWRNFRYAVEKAQTACQTSGQTVSDHFAESSKMIVLGKGGQREIEDFHLSRYACYLIVQNADPSKEIVALGQTYFAIQTRRQELADEAALAGLDEDQKRLYIREQLRSHNKELAAAAYAAGVVTQPDFAVFQDHGYRGLYGGRGVRAIAARKGLGDGQAILDYMGSTELAANLFRATQTEEKLRRERIQGREEANHTHHEVGKEVRATIRRLGGTMPEHLPTPAESIAELRRKQRQLAGHQATPLPPATQSSLFDVSGDDE